MTAQIARAPDEYTGSLTITAYGIPGPQGSKAFKGTFKGKDGRTHAKLVESSKKVKPWREDVKAAAEVVRAGRPPLDGPLRLHMVFTLPKPKSAPKTRKTWPMRTPDLSKLARSTEDALTAAGIWADDARGRVRPARQALPERRPRRARSAGRDHHHRTDGHARCVLGGCMSGLRFKVGELAKVIAARFPRFQNEVVQIVAVGPFKIGDVVQVDLAGGVIRIDYACDYVTDIREEHDIPRWISFHDWQLAKLDPPAEPESITRREEVEA